MGLPVVDLGGMLCGFAVFKAHCAFVLPHEQDIPEIGALYVDGQKKAWGSLGKITSLGDLPPDPGLIKAIQLIAKFNQSKKSRPPRARAAPPAKEFPPIWSPPSRNSRRQGSSSKPSRPAAATNTSIGWMRPNPMRPAKNAWPRLSSG